LWKEREKDSRIVSIKREWDCFVMLSSRCFRCLLLLWFSVAGLISMTSGCRKLESLFTIPAGGGVIHESYPITAYAYEFPVIIQGSPEEFIDHFARELMWLERHADTLKVDVAGLNADTDMTKAGNSVDFSVRILGINLPCRMICLKYKPDEELWWMMNFPSDSWILLRFNIEPAVQGCVVRVDVLGQPARYLTSLIDTFQLLQALALRAELVMTLIQSDFDPELDIREITGRGMRGQLDETFLQGYESSIRVDATPGKITQYIFSDSQNLNRLIPNLDFKGACFDDPLMLLDKSDETIYCPSTYRAGNGEIEAQVLSESEWLNDGKHDVFSHNVWIIIQDTLVKVEFMIHKHGMASGLRMVYAFELPGAHAQQAMDLIIGIADIPDQMNEALVRIRADVEGAI
jgi:hypothetical protein